MNSTIYYGKLWDIVSGTNHPCLISISEHVYQQYGNDVSSGLRNFRSLDDLETEEKKSYPNNLDSM